MSKVIITCVITVDGLIESPVPKLFWVNPTIQGPGDRPFHDGDPIDLELLESRSFNSGVTLLRYRPAGRFKPTSPSEDSA